MDIFHKGNILAAGPANVTPRQNEGKTPYGVRLLAGRTTLEGAVYLRRNEVYAAFAALGEQESRMVALLKARTFDTTYGAGAEKLRELAKSVSYEPFYAARPAEWYILGTRTGRISSRPVVRVSLSEQERRRTAAESPRWDEEA